MIAMMAQNNQATQAMTPVLYQHIANSNKITNSTTSQIIL
jgi:hypothetical protein